MSVRQNNAKCGNGGDEILSKETISKIKETEAQARRIRTDAEEEAKARVRRAEADGQRSFERAEEQAIKQNKEKLRIAKARADEVMKKAEESAQTDADAMREAAEFNMREAVRAIIAGVREQCQ